jgi:hypothetical protein
MNARSRSHSPAWRRNARTSIALAFGALVAGALVRGSNALAAAPPDQYAISEAGAINDGGVVKDIRTGLIWERGASPPRRDYATANTYCAGLSVGTYTTGWRLPQIKELLSVLDVDGKVLPLWDQGAFGVMGPGQLWSQTPDVTQAGFMWGIDLTLAESARYDPTSMQGTLCVHD